MKTKFLEPAIKVAVALALLSLLPVLHGKTLGLSHAQSASICPEEMPFWAEYYEGVALQGTPIETDRDSNCESVDQIWKIDRRWNRDPLKVKICVANCVGKPDGQDRPVYRYEDKTKNFSARWQGEFYFPGGTYIFKANADDGIRVFLDNRNNLVINAWPGQSGAKQQKQFVSTGKHVVIVEYYQRDNAAYTQVDWKLATEAVDDDEKPYALVCLKNPTGWNIRYNYKWGNDAWKSIRVDAHNNRWHSWTYASGSKSSPNFYIRFDADISSGTDYKEKILERYQAATKSCNAGKIYTFKQVGSQRIDLYPTN